MLEAPHNIVHKRIIHIQRRSESDTSIPVSELVKGVICDQITSFFNISLSWSVFTRGGNVTCENNTVSGKIASAKMDDGSSVWALTLRTRDASASRRRWIYRIALHAPNESDLDLYYAKSCYDHMAGSINPPPSIPSGRDTFLDPLFQNDHFQCMSGKYPLPTELSMLTHTTLPTFINHLQDEDRRIPLILISGPCAVSPEKLQDSMLGNAIIYWCDESSVAMRLNAMLPQNMYTPWEAVHVYVSLADPSAFHPLYTIGDIRNYGEKFVPGLIQAYCRSLRSEDIRSFTTTEDILHIRDKQQLASLLSQLKAKNAECLTLKKQYDELNDRHSAIEQKLAAIDEQPELVEYESMLSDLMKEMDGLKRGLSEISTHLFSRNLDALPSSQYEASPYLLELLSGIRQYLLYTPQKKMIST